MALKFESVPVGGSFLFGGCECQKTARNEAANENGARFTLPLNTVVEKVDGGEEDDQIPAGTPAPESESPPSFPDADTIGSILG